MMEPVKITKQVIEFQKTTFDNTFNAMVVLQEQAEKMTKAMLEQSPWVPEEGKKAVQEWIGAYKKGREDFKKMVEENFQRVEDFFSGFDKKNQ